MAIDTVMLHDATFVLLAALAATVVFVAVERIIAFTLTSRALQRLQQGQTAAMTGIVYELHAAITDHRLADLSRNAFEDLTESAYVRARSALKTRLWLVDTIVTAAPLLGLLGTIFGIIEAFLSLAQSGVSDPGAVSRGIGTALYATGAGIAVALFGLLVMNGLNAWLARLSDGFKDAILRGPHHGRETKAAL